VYNRISAVQSRDCSRNEVDRKMRPTTALGRRGFLKLTASCGFATTAGLAWDFSRPSKDSADFRLVAETDRQRILMAASKYLSEAPLNITAFPASHSAGGLHDFYSQADYFWPNPKNPNGPYELVEKPLRLPESEINCGSKTITLPLRIAPGAFWRDPFLTASRLKAFSNKFIEPS